MTTLADTSLRLFFALWPDPATRARLAALQQHVRGRLVRHEDLHLTLAFLGLQPASALPALKDLLAHLPPAEFMLTIDRFGYFAGNRIACAGAHAVPPPLQDLYSQLSDGLAARNVLWDGRRVFKPHITLARDAGPPGDLVFDPIEWPAHEVVLVHSQAQATGPHYRVVAMRRLDEIVRVPDPGEDAPLL